MNNQSHKGRHTASSNIEQEEENIYTDQEEKRNHVSSHHAASSHRKRKSKKLLRTVSVVFVVLLLLIVVAVAVFEIWISAPDVDSSGLNEQTVKQGDQIATPEPTPEPTVTPTAQPTPTPTPTPTPEPTADPGDAPKVTGTNRKENTFTFLVVGEDVVGSNTDTIMVGTLDLDDGSLNIVSIPRDTMVNVEWAVKKVNTYYAMTGTVDGLIDGISELIGYKVDCYAIINVEAFEHIIDAIGGIYFDVPIDMDWGDPIRGCNYSIKAGEQWLDGYNSLGVVRFRQNQDGTGYPTGDIGRIETQQAFAKALMKQLLSVGNIPNLSTIVDIFKENVTTNLTASNLAYFAQQFLKLDTDKITFSTMPFEAVYIKGGSYVSCQLSDWITMINEKLNPYTTPVTESNLDILTCSLNGDFYSTTGVLAGGFDSFYDYLA